MGFIIQIDVHQSNIWEIRREMCKHFLGGGLLPHGLQHCLHLLPLPDGENIPSVKILSNNWHQFHNGNQSHGQIPSSMSNSPLSKIVRTDSLLEELQAALLFSNPENLWVTTSASLGSNNTNHQPTHLSSSWALLS